MNSHRLMLIWIVPALLLALPCPARAHGLSVFAWVEGDTAHVQGKFSGGKYIKGGDVTVMGPGGEELITGKTNDQGVFSFRIPRKSDLKIVISAGMGHQGDWTIRADEIDAELPETSADAAEPATPSPSAPESTPPAGVSPEAIQSAVERALDKKLKPVIRMLADERQRVGATEIFGGIGYIFGLVGIAAYFMSRRKRASEGEKVR